MILGALSDILVRISSIATLCLSLTGDPTPITSPQLTIDTENFSTSGTFLNDSTYHSVATTLSELRTIRDILNLPLIQKDQAFRDFLTSIEDALTRYEKADERVNTLSISHTDVSQNLTYSQPCRHSNREILESLAYERSQLVNSLMVARSNLENSISSLSGWLAIVQTRNLPDRCVSVPERFVSKTASLTPEPPPDSNDIKTLFEFDQVYPQET